MDAYLFSDAMLQYLKDYCMGSLVCLSRTDKPEDDSCHEEWDKVLDQMIFLWRESYKYSSSKKNPYEEEYMEILDKYYDKYGSNMGLAMMRNDSKYKKISDKNEKAEGEINQCREECKEKRWICRKNILFLLRLLRCFPFSEEMAINIIQCRFRSCRMMRKRGIWNHE